MLDRVLVLALALPASAQPLEWRRRALPVMPVGYHGRLLAHDTIRHQAILVLHEYSRLPFRHETWEWDGVAWSLRATDTPEGVAMAFDAARGVTLLLEPAPRQGLWEWDGRIWSQRTPAHRPPALHSPFLACDSTRGRVVLVGQTFDPPPFHTITYEWDGSDWLDRTPLESPPPRSGFGLVHDAGRGRVVLFGSTVPALLVDTWEWDGTTWTPVPSALAPPAGVTAFGYDPVSRMVLAAFGSPFSTWAWDGAGWRRLEPATIPPPRQYRHFLIDPARGRLRLLDPWGADMWEWDGTDWRPERPRPRPQLLLWAPPAAAQDSVRGRVLMQDSEAGNFDISEWDGAVWERRTAPSPTPSFVEAPTMAFDEVRGRTVLFGGFGGCGRYSCYYPRDTWEWDGSAWSMIPTEVQPPGRQMASMTYDHWRRRVLLFGGLRDSWSGCLNDFWEWDGIKWRELPSRPGPRVQAGLAFDVARGVMVLFGGYREADLTDTWEWDGTAWAERHPARPPPAPGPMTWHTERQRVVLAAGDGSTWEWDGRDWNLLVASGPRGFALLHDAARGRSVLLAADPTRTFVDVWELAPAISVRGPGHPGGGLGITWSAPPRVGQPFCVSFPLSPPQGARWHLLLLASGAGLGQPAALGPPSMCAPAWVHVAPQVVLVANGDPAGFCLALPDHPALAGTLVTLQGASLVVGGCWLATDAVEAVVLP